MKCIYGVTFKENGKCFFFKYLQEELNINTKVVCNSDIGEVIGEIVKKQECTNLDNYEEIVRVVTNDDLKKDRSNKQEATKALKKAKELASKMNLKMNILDANFTLDKKQLLFNFYAEERIDFRELAKSLAAIYKVRIELRQIGVRDKAKDIGGIGQCGRCLCCKSFLDQIGSISINMVKNQNIAINPTKINGQCGRLLCCLTYEDEEYRKCQNGLPQVGDIVKVDGEDGKVVSVDILNRMYKVDIKGNKKEVKVNCEENCS